MVRTSTAALLVCLVLWPVQGCGKDSSSSSQATLGSVETPIDALPLNQIQVIGSHNSYRLRTPSPLFEALQSLSWLLPSEYDPKQLDYTHVPIDVQLEQYRVRSLEIDFYRDPSGGRFYHRQGNKFVLKPTASGVPELLEPGSKVLHIADIDYATNYFTLTQALSTVRDWSNAHPHHLPLFILLEPKDDTLDSSLPGLGFTKVLPWDGPALIELDQEVASVFAETPGKIFTPDELRGNALDLPSAISSQGWPTVGQMRGRIVFLMFAGTEQRAAYVGGTPPLAGRLIFPFAHPGDPDAAFVRWDDPRPNLEKIESAVQAGYIVRTRSDEGTYEARKGSTDRREKAFASGAQLVCTDYYRPDSRAGTPGWTDFSVSFPDQAPGRVHPYLGPAEFLGQTISE